MFESMIDKAVATPAGISVSSRVDGYPQTQLMLVKYLTAIEQLEDGYYDERLTDGMRVIAALMDAGIAGYFKPTTQQLIIAWRSVVVFLFISEQIGKNGLMEIVEEDDSVKLTPVYAGDGGAFPIYPSVERFSLANHIEGLALSHFHDADPQGKALAVYQHMVGEENGVLCLSKWGREGLAMLHDSFLETLVSEGLPPEPVSH